MTCFNRRALVLVAAVFPTFALSQQLPKPEPLGDPATKVYRQVTSDGRIVYSDKPIPGAKIDETIVPDPETNVWTPETGKPPVVPPRAERTSVSKVPSIPAPGKVRTLGDADADVIRAEMMLEDAKKRQEEGVEPLPGERSGLVTGKSRLNEAYWERQRALAQETAEAESMVRKARNERESIRVSPSQR
ncbi:hypothetical protein GCM10027343_42300 [Noviherbaspirillum agri]